ncbi:response regulator transcription factor [Solirubrobacter ginsenosidimutans]|uniref:Response regulator transcription factor n=1 Tax=Solirubrobacter ginsenosidimutans TaxID=490573 RepID=A0A9X3S3F8_9ACTN|nr:response regulator transcription factor [Solirubrobacter ginsenosidimutans]MDA0165690.1 response regulator transcription factor [Solirubrobacter ginsenosidimutans]
MPTVRGSVLLVDNQDLVHIGLRLVLQRQDWVTRIIGARQRSDAIMLAVRHQPRVALVDLFVGEEFGTEICVAIRHAAPAVQVLLTSSGRSLTQDAARAAGAAGFVPKDGSVWDLLNALRSAASGETRFTRQPEPVHGALSPRQQEILELMARGATNSKIARTLDLSVDMVKHHTTAIYRRLEVSNRAAAVHRAQRLGVLAPEVSEPQWPAELPVEQLQRRAA